jgi:outer membrane protein OmpA-like peptidoglycan-associated protein
VNPGRRDSKGGSAISRTPGIALALALALGAAPASAADASFEADWFHFAPGAHDVLGVSGARIAPSLGWNVSVGLSWADGLLELEQPGGTVDLLGSGSSLQLGGALAIGRFEVGAVLPLAFGRSTESGGVLPAAPASGMGDLRVVPKVLLPSLWGFRFAATLPLTLPTGEDNALLGYGGMTVSPTGVVERDVLGVRAVGNLGVVVRGEHQYYDLTVGPAVALGLAGELPFEAFGRRWAALASVTGEVGLSDSGTEAKPFELDGALRFEGPHGIDAIAGLGTALVDGYGAPSVRVFALVGWRPGRDAPVATAATAETSAPPRVEPAPQPEPEPAPEPTPPPEAQPATAAPAAVSPQPAPDAGAAETPRAVLTESKIELREAVYFDLGKDTIQARSFALLDDVARILRENPQVARVSIEGHTDASGPADLNRKLSKARAEAVKAYLVSKGVAAERLEAQGFGPDRPVADNATKEGRERNRRVEFAVSGSR